MHGEVGEKNEGRDEAPQDVCWGCGTSDGVAPRPSFTAYAQPELTYWDRVLLDGEDPPDPNADIPLCEDCFEAHEEHWTEMWEEYHRSCL